MVILFLVLESQKKDNIAVTDNFHVQGKKLFISDEILRINDVSQENVNFVRAYAIYIPELGYQHNSS